MIRKLGLACALMMVLSATYAQAQPTIGEGYIGGSYNFLTYEEDGFSDEVDLGAIVGQAGAQINPYFSAELRAGFGVDDYKVTAGSAAATIEVDYLIGGYGLVGIPTNTPIYPYVLGGFTQSELTVNASGPGGTFSASESESDVSYGVGAKLAISKKVSLTAEYVQYFEESDYEISSINVGGQLKF